MSAKRLVKELERHAAREPENLAVRLRLAAALRVVGRREEGTALVRSVAASYHVEGRLAQALAVCRSLLELEPDDMATRALFVELEAMRTGASPEEPTRLDDGTGRRPAPLPVVEADPADVEIVDEFEGLDGDGDGHGDGDVRDSDVSTSVPATGGERTRPRRDGSDDEPAGRNGDVNLGNNDDDDEESLDTAPTPLSEIVDPAALPFSRLSAGAQRDLHGRRLRRRYKPGDVIVREGEPGESCFVLSSGLVRVLRRNPARPGESLEVARLGAGELFGEFALLADRRRHATVQAIDAVNAFEIPRRVLRELAAAHPGVASELERLYRERLLANLVKRAPFFRVLPAEKRRAMAVHFASCRFEAGQPIVKEGDRGGAFYLVVLGAVEVTRRAGGRGAVLLATLGEGQYFGEMSLAAGSVCAATVSAAGPTELAELPRRDFVELVSAHPAVWDELRSEAQRRELGEANILAGETSLV